MLSVDAAVPSAVLLGGYCVALVAGAAIVPAHFSASTFVDDLRRYGATYVHYVGKALAYVLATRRSPTTPTSGCARRSAMRPLTAT